MEPLPSNTRYILELERDDLIQQRLEFDEKYSTFSFFFVQTFQVLAILAYLCIAVFLVFSRKIRAKTNAIVTIWALINLAVLTDRAVKVFNVFFSDDEEIVFNEQSLCQMLAGLGRLYGTSLVVVWLCSKYFDEPKPRYGLLLYFLILVPAFVGAYFVFYYFNVDRYIYEVFGPGCDIVSAVTYLVVGLVYVLCKIFLSKERSVSAYPLLLSLASLVTNLPISLITIYLRFNLDIAWSYRFHIYFVDLFVNLCTASNGMVALFIVLLYHKCLNKMLDVRVKYFECNEQKSDL